MPRRSIASRFDVESRSVTSRTYHGKSAHRPSCRVCAEGGVHASGNAHVVVCARELAFLVGQVRVTYGSDEAPMLADRAVLQPGYAEVECLELDPGNPDRREEMATAAAHNCVAAQVVAATPGDERGSDDRGYHDQRSRCDETWPHRRNASHFANVSIYRNVNSFVSVELDWVRGQR